MSTDERDNAVDAIDTVDGAGCPPTKRRNDVVVGIDNSPSAATALLWAAEHARTNGLPLRVVHAWQLSAAASAAVAAGDGEYFEAAGADARARATRFVLDVLGGSAAEFRWTLDIGEGARRPGARGPVEGRAAACGRNEGAYRPPSRGQRLGEPLLPLPRRGPGRRRTGS